MEDKNKEILKKAIDDLKKHQAPPASWENFQEAWEAEESELNRKGLKVAIESLPQRRFERNIFENIISEVEKEENGLQLFKIKRIHWVSGLAASVALLIGFWLGNLNNETVIEISYSEQEVEQQASVLPVLKAQLHEEDEILQFIQQNCKTVQLTCSQPDFKALLEEYVALEADRKELLQTIKANQEPEKLMKYLVRVEKKKTELGKQLMQKLI